MTENFNPYHPLLVYILLKDNPRDKALNYPKQMNRRHLGMRGQWEKTVPLQWYNKALKKIRLWHFIEQVSKMFPSPKWIMTVFSRTQTLLHWFQISRSQHYETTMCSSGTHLRCGCLLSETRWLFVKLVFNNGCCGTADPRVRTGQVKRKRAIGCELTWT